MSPYNCRTARRDLQTMFDVLQEAVSCSPTSIYAMVDGDGFGMPGLFQAGNETRVKAGRSRSIQAQPIQFSTAGIAATLSGSTYPSRAASSARSRSER